MRFLTGRALVVPAILALGLTVGGCGHAEEQATNTWDSLTAENERDEVATPPSLAPTPEARSGDAQAFLDELTEFGLPTGLSADTTVEVGLGICQNIHDGVDTDTILDHLRPLSSAVATQSADHDTDRVGRAIVDASRSHLCD